MADHGLVSMRVNSALLPRFKGKTVRLVCRPLRAEGRGWLVQACDGGEVSVDLSASQLSANGSHFEVIGDVVGDKAIKLARAVDLGPDLDMQLVNDTIHLIHDPRFYSSIFAE